MASVELCRAHSAPKSEAVPACARCVRRRNVSMAETLLYFTELVSMPVFDLRGRRIGRIKDAALVPLVHPSRIDRFLMGGTDAALTIRYDQIGAIDLRRGIT